jgi:hypothetical protein
MMERESRYGDVPISGAMLGVGQKVAFLHLYAIRDVCANNNYSTERSISE